MSDKVETIPVIDFAPCSMQDHELDVSSNDVLEVARLMVDAFSAIGFVYLRNCGVSKQLIQSTFSCSKEFFSLPLETKKKYSARGEETDHQGYFGVEEEVFDQTVPGDLKESFDFTLSVSEAPIWTTEVVQFKSILMKFFEECSHLTARILKLLAIGLKLDDADFFVRRHNMTTTTQAYGTGLRTLYYPPVLPGTLKPGQKRLGEHTDYGTITLVFQDDAGGLQVRGTDGRWIDATPMEDANVVNIADMLQRWTCDKLVSTAHRIVALHDNDDDGRKFSIKARQSLVFFAQPDPDVEIVCIDGSNRYEPVKSGEYTEQRILDTAKRY